MTNNSQCKCTRRNKEYQPGHSAIFSFLMHLLIFLQK
jgi:hypothetical protein